jgi:hypothetical protein
MHLIQVLAEGGLLGMLLMITTLGYSIRHMIIRPFQTQPETALLALITGGAQSYTMDTGQTRQTVNKLDVPALQRQLNGAYALLDALETRAGSGSVIAGPLC